MKYKNGKNCKSIYENVLKNSKSPRYVKYLHIQYSITNIAFDFCRITEKFMNGKPDRQLKNNLC